MTDWTELWMLMMIGAAGLGVLSGFAGWGSRKWLRMRDKQRVRRTERVRFASDVNIRLLGYEVRRNHFNVLVYGAAWLFLLLWHPGDLTVLVGTFLYLGYLVRHVYSIQEERFIQTMLLTERGLHVMPAQGMNPAWKREKPQFLAWRDVDGYRIDGSYLLFYRDEQVLLQVEFGLHDYEQVRQVLCELGVARLELTDRIWVAQLDEPVFYRMEDHVCELGWDVLELFREELERLNVRPEFGVMRNVQGDRLLEEHSRSWLQLNLLDLETEQRVIHSSFPLWHCYGNVGYLNGLVEQEMVDHLQRWIKGTLQEGEREREREGVVS